MIEQPKLNLIYFRLRALTEAAQMMMHFSDIKYSYEMSWDYYKKPWSEAKKETPFNQLPVLVVNDDVHIWQSSSVVRYLAPLTNTKPKDDLTTAKVDAIFESTQELFYPLNPTVNVFTGEMHKKLKDEFLLNFPSILSNFNKILETSIDGPYFMGKNPYYCDFSAYHHFSLSRLLDSSVLDQYPRILELMEAIEEIPSISNYLKSRPKLIDIGVSPKMIINGESFPTGVNNN